MEKYIIKLSLTIKLQKHFHMEILSRIVFNEAMNHLRSNQSSFILPTESNEVCLLIFLLLLMEKLS